MKRALKPGRSRAAFAKLDSEQVMEHDDKVARELAPGSPTARPNRPLQFDSQFITPDVCPFFTM